MFINIYFSVRIKNIRKLKFHYDLAKIKNSQNALCPNSFHYVLLLIFNLLKSFTCTNSTTPLSTLIPTLLLERKRDFLDSYFFGKIHVQDKFNK